jgi:hypothetical protein
MIIHKLDTNRTYYKLNKNEDTCHNQVNLDPNQNNPVYKHTRNLLVLFVDPNIQCICLEIHMKDKGRDKADK